MNCLDCANGVMHIHLAAERILLHRWLHWVAEWGDKDMLQALVADTMTQLSKGDA